MRAFVTGSTGFLGRHLVRELLAHGYQVTVLVRTLDRARRLPDGLQYTAGDITKPASMRPGLRGAQVIFHAAALRRVGVRPKEVERLQRINVEGTRQVLQLAAELGVGRVVCTSDLAIFGSTNGQPIDESARPAADGLESEYARSKRQAFLEAAQAHAGGLPVVTACLGSLYGPGDTTPRGAWQRRLIQRRLPLMAGAARVLSWVHAADAARGLRLAAERGQAGATYFLAGPGHSWREVLEQLAALAGVPTPLWLPERLRGWGEGLARRSRPDLAEFLRGFAPFTCLARADKAAAELGWQARPLADGLRDTLEDLRRSA